MALIMEQFQRNTVIDLAISIHSDSAFKMSTLFHLILATTLKTDAEIFIVLSAITPYF